MRRRIIATILTVLVCTSVVPCFAINEGESTDKYSDTTASQEDRRLSENINNTEKDDDTKITGNYLEATVSPSQIQQSSGIPEGYEFHFSPSGGYGYPVYVTNDVGVYIQRDAPRRILKGTVIRSINNKIAADLYTPTISELPWLKSKIIKDYNFAALYTGEWDIDKTVADTETGLSDAPRTQNGQNVVETRANKILGNDALVVNESYSPTAGYTSKAIKSNGGLSLRDAITISYKALSDNYYWIQAYCRSHLTNNFPVEQTPFAELVGAENVSVDHTRYYTDIWVSRTCPETYFNQAKRDGITSYDYTSSEAYSKNITVADFCVIVAKLLDLNGEDVIIDQEAQQLLSFYQRQLPAYLPSVQRDAAKYLMVRGIVDGTEDFDANISGEEVLAILMRAKDKSSRLTFKQIDVPYDETLLAKDFTGIDLNTDAPATSIRVTNNKAVAEYYDYMVRKSDATTFTDINGKDVTAVFVSTGDNSKTRLDGSDYIGCVNSYYHFKVPINSTNALKVVNGIQVYTVTTFNNDNKPSKYYIEAGGGVYDTFEKVKEDGQEILLCRRTPFTSTDDHLLTDANRKKSEQIAMNDSDEIKLTDNDYTAQIQVKDKETTKWAGKAVKDITNNPAGEELGGATVHFTKYSILVVKFKEEKNPWDAISRNLEYDPMSNTENNKYVAYIKGGETTPILLVSTSWLRNKSEDLPNPITDVKQLEEENKYEIATANGPIQVDTKAKTYAIGGTYVELGQNDESPMIVKSDTGDYYVDFRIIQGSIAGFMLFDDKDGTKSAVPTGVKDGIKTDDASVVPQYAPIKSLTGASDDTLTVGALTAEGSKSKDALMLEGPYAKANYMIYKLNREGLKGDYLLVFKPAVEEYSDPNRDKIKELLEKNFKIALGNNTTCTIYNLDSTVRLAEGSVINNLQGCIEHKAGYGYLYTIPEVSSFDIQKYYEGGNDINCPLPIVKEKNSSDATKYNYYDVNTNHVKGFPWDRVPGELLTDEMKERTNNCDLIYNRGFTSDGKKLQFSKDSELLLAPIGLTACYKDEYSKDVKALLSATNDSTYRAIGSMGGKIEDKLNSATYFNFNISDGVLNYKLKSTDTFYLAGGNSSIAKSKSYGIYVYKDPNGVGVTSVEDLNGAEMSLNQGKARNIFDWEAFTFIQALKTASDITAILYIIVVEVLPRIMLFDFFMLATLSLIANNNFTQTLCRVFFDPYKILSLGMLDVNTIDPRRIWMTVLFASVYLTMFNYQDFAKIFGWIVGTLLELLGR